MFFFRKMFGLTFVVLFVGGLIAIGYALGAGSLSAAPAIAPAFWLILAVLGGWWLLMMVFGSIFRMRVFGRNGGPRGMGWGHHGKFGHHHRRGHWKWHEGEAELDEESSAEDDAGDDAPKV